MTNRDDAELNMDTLMRLGAGIIAIFRFDDAYEETALVPYLELLLMALDSGAVSSSRDLESIAKLVRELKPYDAALCTAWLVDIGGVALTNSGPLGLTFCRMMAIEGRAACLQAHREILEVQDTESSERLIWALESLVPYYEDGVRPLFAAEASLMKCQLRQIVAGEFDAAELMKVIKAAIDQLEVWDAEALGEEVWTDAKTSNLAAWRKNFEALSTM